MGAKASDEQDGRSGADLAYLKRISQVQEITFQRLLDGSEKMLPEVADLCEDIGNLYLNIADDIRAAVKVRAQTPEERPQSDVLASLLATGKD